MRTVSDYFGCMVFDDRMMRAKLSAEVYASLRKTIDEGMDLDIGVANAVAEAMKKLNYRPNELARSLQNKNSNTIGVIVPHIRHPYFAEMISNLENESQKEEVSYGGTAR